MRLLLAKFCEYACKLENQRHSMVGIFDDIRVPGFPIDHPAFFLCLQFEFEPPEAGSIMKVEAILMDEDGKQMFRAELNGEVPPSQTVGVVKLFAQIGVPPIRFERAGDYRLDVVYNGLSAGEERVPVFAVSPPPA
jgi:hypothetical protein